jgi:2-phospho-L-lactate transferase/gluconeogenesis factor (CofD/UPF0052 family)
MINVVVFNGGRGARNLIPTLLATEGINLTSIVNAYDDGKSTGNIRSFFRMLGPSDIRKVQEVMVPRTLPDYAAVMQLFDFRYGKSVDHHAILAEITAFAQGQSASLAGISLSDAIIRESLRSIMLTLVKAIRLIEKAEQKQLDFSDCSIMNLIYAGAFLHCNGNFEEATILIDKLFKLQGTVLPTNNEDKKLVAIREDGTILYSEAEIVELRSNSRIKKIYLLDQYPDRDLISKMDIRETEAYFEMMNRQVLITSRVARSISDADIIIYSTGTQHSSLYPSYITRGLTDAIVANKKAFKVFVTNIGEDYETPSYTAYDFITGALRYLRIGAGEEVPVSNLIDVALVNNCFSNKSLENYVTFDKTEVESIGCRTVIDAFEDTNNPGKHDGAYLAAFIINQYLAHFKIN